MNRVKDYYETMSKFCKIAPEGQFWIAGHFKVLSIAEFVLPQEEMAALVILKIIDKNLYTEFKQLIGNYKHATYQQ